MSASEDSQVTGRGRAEGGGQREDVVVNRKRIVPCRGGSNLIQSADSSVIWCRKCCAPFPLAPVPPEILSKIWSSVQAARR